MPHHPQIDDEDAQQLLRLLRKIAINEPGVLDMMADYDPDTGRSSLNAGFMESYRDDPLYHGLDGVDWENRNNCRYLSFLADGALDYIEARPTLLRLSAEKWMGEVKGRQANQRGLRRAAIQAVVLRAIHEDATNVVMSRNSLSKMIETITGKAPGRAPLKNLFLWFDHRESPFEVVCKGKPGWFGPSTILKVTVASLENWASGLDKSEQAITEQWLADQDHVLGELYADEATRKLDRPKVKSRQARAKEIDAAIAKFEQEAKALFPRSASEPGTANGRGGRTLPNSSKLTDVDESKLTPMTFAKPDPEAEKARQEAINREFDHLLPPEWPATSEPTRPSVSTWKPGDLDFMAYLGFSDDDSSSTAEG